MDESESVDSLYLAVVSDTARVPVVLDRIREFVRRQGCGESDALLLVVRELLMNAIVHGNESDPTRVALVRVGRRGALFEVQVDDEGSGFDYESLALGLPEEPRFIQRRGLVLAHELSRELAFERGGSRVRALVDPEADSPDSHRAGETYAGGMSNREEPCTSPMAKSL